MKAKFVSTLSLTLLLLLFIFTLTACGHEHVASGWIMDPPATCTSVGYRYQKCISCGEILQKETYNTSHSYEEGFCIYCKRPQYNEEHLKYERVTLNGEEGYTVAGIGNCYSVDLRIPEKHNSLPVLAISDNAFVNAVRIESVVIPKTVQRIGSRAFYKCEPLKTVQFADGSSCVSIGDFAFAECPKLRTVEIPSGVTVLGNSLFSGCLKLKNLTLHDGIKEVGEDAFGGCTELLTNEENGLVYLGTATNPYLILMDVTDRGITAITPNESTRIIAPGALAGCVALTQLTLPEGLLAISPYAFSGCIALNALTIPAGVTVLGNYALQDCTALTAISLPTGLLRIGVGAFSNCASLTTLTLPESLTHVGATAFFGCGKLQFNTHGTGKYLGTATNPYFLLCGHSAPSATDTPHADNRLVAAHAESTIIP